MSIGPSSLSQPEAELPASIPWERIHQLFDPAEVLGARWDRTLWAGELCLLIQTREADYGVLHAPDAEGCWLRLTEILRDRGSRQCGSVAVVSSQ